MERFWSKVQKTDTCWLWLASCDGKGYGQFNHAGKMRRSHIVAYELSVSLVPDGLELDHLCRNRRCVNPSHLDPVTHKVNMLRGRGVGSDNARKRHCKHGHEFTQNNTYIRPNGNRDCRLCIAARSNQYSLRRAA